VRDDAVGQRLDGLGEGLEALRGVDLGDDLYVGLEVKYGR